ncbi:hypothetical protein HY383_04440 [Candidatus Daviesbacteria bacterium]|nr:hypothetical protein [Candidatus Daviesbacteria bacterium]
MGKEKCLPPVSHTWVCRQSSGLAGEVVQERSLTAEQVVDVLRDTTKAQEICPDGVIICNKCDDRLGGSLQQQGAIIDFKDLARRLSD